MVCIAPAAPTAGSPEWSESPKTHDVVLATRLVEMQGGSIDTAGRTITIRLG